MPTQILMTAEGFAQLKSELNDLKTIKRREISEKIKVARGFGDLSENSEYDEAKNEQAIVEARISLLDEQLKTAKILTRDAIPKDVISIGSKVKILDIEYNEDTDYIITSSIEANQSMNTITDESPVGKALMGKKLGDEVDVILPNGSTIQFKILSIG